MDLGCAICGGTAEEFTTTELVQITKIQVQPRAALCVRHNIAVGWFEHEDKKEIQKYLLEWQ